MTLTARQQQVLRIIVDEYVHTPMPVASESVTLKMPVHFSPATIRNEIAVLEDGGYITRPHTSAGGVPSNKAYRAYVESLGDDLEPSRKVKQLVRRNFKETRMDVEARGRSAVRLLAELVHSMAISTVPIEKVPRWKHLDIVHIQGLLVMLIMVLQGSARLRQRQLLLKEPMTQDQLTQTSNKLNAHFTGLSRSEIYAKDVDLTEMENGLVNLAVDLLNDENESSVPDHFVDGLRHMFSYPELTEVTYARAVAELLEYQHLVRLLMEKAPERGVVRVSIGEESKEDILRPFTVVFARYGVHPEASGVIGVMGPTRFEYASAISSVKYLASVMTDLAWAI